MTVTVTITNPEETHNLTEISETENASATEALNYVLEKWKLTPIEETVGPIADGEVTQSNFSYIMSPSLFYKEKHSILATFYEAKVFKYNLKTSIYVEVFDDYYDQDESSAFVYRSFVGAKGKLKLHEDVTTVFLPSTYFLVNHKEFDVLYLVVFLIRDYPESFHVITHLSNDVEVFEEALKTYYIIIGSVLGGVVFIGIIIIIVCCILERRTYY
jgi:hypothetical protein